MKTIQNDLLENVRSRGDSQRNKRRNKVWMGQSMKMRSLSMLLWAIIGQQNNNCWNSIIGCTIK